MRISRAVIFVTALVGSGLVLVPAAHTLDAQVPPISAAARAEAASLFASAFTAYAAGEKDKALEAYQSAAELGHIGALWKVGRMYEVGDGIDVDAFEAFRSYRTLATLHGNIAPNDRDAVFVASAFVSLGRYLLSGIGERLAADPISARDTFFYAASYFGDREAQYRVGRMMVDGVGGDPLPRQGVRWLKLASDKGHIGATAVLGELLFDGRYVRQRPVLGLSMLTRARQLARDEEREWIEELQERAFAAASEEVRRRAVESAEAELTGEGG